MAASTLDQVLAIAEHQSGIKNVTPDMALDQDLQISGDDVTELVDTLAKRFGAELWNWPWQRFAELSEPSLLVFPYFIWRLLTWPIRDHLFDPSPFERLEMRHIADCIEAGHWIEP